MANIWHRFSYLWTIVIGWALFGLCVLIDTVLFFWVGVVAGVVFALATMFLSARRLAETTRDVVVHGLAWTLAFALGFLSLVWVYGVFQFVL